MKDEASHYGFACLLYRNYIENKLPTSLVEQIVREAVELEIEFMCEALPVALLGMNNDLMAEHIKYVGDCLLINIGLKPIYKVGKSPFSFADIMSTDNKENFFEKDAAEYNKAGVGLKEEDKIFTMDADF